MKDWIHFLWEGAICGTIAGLLYWMFQGFPVREYLLLPLGAGYGAVIGLFVGLVFFREKKIK